MHAGQARLSTEKKPASAVRSFRDVSILFFFLICSSLPWPGRAADVSEQALRDALLRRGQSDLTGLDLNQDGKVDIADLVKMARFGPSVSFATRTTAVLEGQRVVTVEVRFTQPFSGTIQYDVAGTATPGPDYRPIAGNLPVNGTNASFAIELEDDVLIEGTETLVLTLRAPPTNSPIYALGGSTIHTVFIEDNDARWQGELMSENLRLSFAMTIAQGNSAPQGTLVSDGSGTFPSGQWPAVLQITPNRFAAVIGPISIQPTNTLLNAQFSRWLYLTAAPDTNVLHHLDLNSSIVGSMREEFVFEDTARQHLNRAGASAITGSFVLQRPSPNLPRAQPSLTALP